MIASSLPRVALVGRTNVGKSTLFNRITKRTESIVYDQEGVTRDYVHEAIEWKGKRFELIDTGGFVPQESDDLFHAHIQDISKKACEAADVIMFVVDAKNGITMEDQLLARQLHSLNKAIILILNKADSSKDFQAHEADFYALGFAEHYPVSAVHGSGISEMLTAVAKAGPPC